jgi:aspartyl-tRNA(Asn)/glutamyl-tRNA(Gln) amidotransferase subunit C
MQIDANTVKTVASLSAIDLSDDEVEQYKDELSKVLSFVEQLDQLPLESVMPKTDAEKVESPVTATLSGASPAPFRQDAVVMELSREALMGNAVDVEEGAYVVPNIL